MNSCERFGNSQTREGEREGEVAEVDNKVVEAVVVAFSCQQILNDP